MMNKVIKFVLLILFSVISLSTANIIKNNEADKQVAKNFNVQGYRQIYLPSSIVDNEKIASIAEDVSSQIGASFVFRSSYGGYAGNGKGEIDLSSSKNNFVFYQTNYKEKNKKTYLSHGFKYNFWNAPLKDISKVQLENADIFVESRNDRHALQEFVKKINQTYYVKTNAQSLIVQPEGYMPDTASGFLYTNYNLILFIGISLVFFAVFLFVWLVGNNKAIATYRLNGAGSFMIGKRLFLEEFLIVSVVVYLVSSLLLFQSFNFDYSVLMFVMTFLVIGLSYISIGIVSSFSLANQINSKSFFKYSHYILYGIKAFVFLVTVSTTASLLYFVNTGFSTHTKLDYEYGVIYPAIGGYEGNNFSNPSALDLFYYAENHAGLYVNVLSANIDKVRTLSDLQVNTNYLSRFTVLSTENKKIKIDADQSSGVVLISEKYKSQLPQIKKYYASSDSLSSFQASTFKYYIIKNNQKLELLDGLDSKSTPDIIEVYTSKNIVDNGNINFLNSPVMKYKINGSIEKSYAPLIPIFKKYNVLESNPSMVRVADINKVDNLSTVGNPYSYAVTNGLVFLIFISMILATTIFYFETYKKKIAVKNLYGASFFNIYKSLFTLVFCQAVVFLAYAMTQSDKLVTAEALGIYFIIEISIIALVLRHLKKNLLLDVLKGE
ncbi:DUF1430 domain-containing protein [Lactococcus lactis]|uniref:DUF1430 domain-containing protein n=1 Tax=Lactococcus lactis TaxID=1358 RepID=UPI0022E3E4F8|nr:DUF1430 domain-containing protein [Lactococcus lactis]